MANYIEYKDTIAFHPGYYIQEIVEDSGLTQEDFAKRLGTTPKNLSVLIRGQQGLSVDIAMRLSKMLGASLSYWLNLQNAYDTAIAQIAADKEMEEEIAVLKTLGYGYFREHFHLPDLPRRLDEQVVQVRAFLQVSSLLVFRNRDMAVSFRSAEGNMREANIIKANAMVQIAVNEALGVSVPRFDKKRFRKAVEFALEQTTNHSGFYPLVKAEFEKAGVIFVVLPNLPGSKINGATKKIGQSVMLMVNDRRLNSDSFWFTLMHEVGHIENGDYGISFDGESGSREDAADRFAEDILIPPGEYAAFVGGRRFSPKTISSFAASIGRDPGIVLGRLQNDHYVRYDDKTMEPLRCKYEVSIAG